MMINEKKKLGKTKKLFFYYVAEHSFGTPTGGQGAVICPKNGQGAFGMA
jgi:hypothetical protein